MWLRDHVPLDIPNSRVLIYGYSSDVGNTDSITTLSEITENFIMDLVSYRLGSPSQTNKVRPIHDYVLTSKLGKADG